MARVQEELFTASDGAHIFVRRWEPPEGQAPKAVLHIHHGLGEHSLRYARFAERAVAVGLAVVAHDARGHGRTSEAEGSPGLGCIACGKEGALPRMVADLAELILASRAARPDAPILLLGHSFGTVVARLCMCAYAAGASAQPPPIDGLVLSAPPARIIGLLAPAFRALLGTLHLVHGDHGISSVPAKLSFDKFQAKILAVEQHTGPVTGWEWLNRSKEEVQKYVDDPHCGHDLSMGFWSSAVPGILALKSPATYAKLSKDCPIGVFAGDRDFCTYDDFGAPSYRRVQEELASAGRAAPKVVVYPGARHEIMMETNAEEVHDDMLSFLLTCLEKRQPRSRM